MLELVRAVSACGLTEQKPNCSGATRTSEEKKDRGSKVPVGPNDVTMIIPVD